MGPKAGTPPPWQVATGELAALFTHLDERAYLRFARWFDRLSTENRIFFTAQGRSGLVARMSAMRFMHMGFDSHVVGEATAPSIQEGDHLLAISGSGITPVTLGFIEVARRVGAQVGLLTQREDSPMGMLAQASLTLPAWRTEQFGGTLFEAAALVTMDAITHDQITRRGISHDLMAERHTNFL